MRDSSTVGSSMLLPTDVVGRRAAECYMRAADIQEKQNDTQRQASYLQEAGHVMKKTSLDGISDVVYDI